MKSQRLEHEYEGVLRHVTAADGTRIAWHTHHEREDSAFAARPPVVLTNGLSTTENFWKDVARSLGHRYRVAHWHYRGHGRSESARSGDYAIATHVDDLVRVTEEVRRHGTSKTAPVHVAFSMGVTVLLELYRRRPDLVGAMVFVAGGADHPYASSRVFRVPGATRAMRAALRVAAPIASRTAPIVRHFTRSPVAFAVARATRAIGPMAPREDVEQMIRAVGQMDMGAYFRTLQSLMDAHASDVLRTVRVPALVIAPEGDVMALRKDLEALRNGIRGAAWMVLPGTTHAVLLEAGAAIGDRIGRFCEDAARAHDVS